MNAETSEYNKLLHALLQSPQVTENEKHIFTEIRLRNSTAYSFKQRRWFRKVAKRIGIDFVAPEERQQIGELHDHHYTHCSLERLEDGTYSVVDAKGKRYGKPGLKADLIFILPWFNEVLNNMDKERKRKRKRAKGCPF